MQFISAAPDTTEADKGSLYSTGMSQRPTGVRLRDMPLLTAYHSLDARLSKGRACRHLFTASEAFDTEWEAVIVQAGMISVFPCQTLDIHTSLR
jgi:hypothetical protein